MIVQNTSAVKGCDVTWAKLQPACEVQEIVWEAVCLKTSSSNSDYKLKDLFQE